MRSTRGGILADVEDGEAPATDAAPTGKPEAPPAAEAPPLRTEAISTAAVELFAKVHIFAGLQVSYLRRIAAVGTREHHSSGAMIFSEGATGDKMYLILSGAVRISRQVPGMGEEALAVLKAGDYFG